MTRDLTPKCANKVSDFIKMATLLKNYLTRTYLIAFSTISTGLAALCNIVELFERLLYAPHVAISDTLLFIALNMVPLWLTLLPITTFLAMIATLHHLQSRHEWHMCWALGIRPRQLMRPLMSTVALLMGTVFIAKHLCLDQLTDYSRQHYQQVYKKAVPHVVRDIWHVTPTGTVYQAREFATHTGVGRDLTIYCYKHSRFTHTLQAPTFTLTGNTVYLPRATKTTVAQGPTTLTGITHRAPTLAAQLQAHGPVHSFIDLLLAWWHEAPGDNALLVQACDEVLPLGEALILALLALLVFMYGSSQLVAVIAVYPALLALQLLLTTLLPSRLLATGTAYLLIALGILAFAKRKNSRILGPTV